MKASIIVPCYNEEGNIGRMVKQLLELYPEDQIIVVLDGCTDKSLNEIKKYKDKIIIIENKLRVGKTESIIGAIDISHNPLIVFIDADFQYNPEDIKKMKKRCERYDIVVADRYEGEGPKELMLIRILIFCFRKLHGIKIKDIQAGFKCVQRDKIKDIEFESDDFIFDLELLIKLKENGCSIRSIPIICKEREIGENKYNKQFLMFWKMLKYMIKR